MNSPNPELPAAELQKRGFADGARAQRLFASLSKSQTPERDALLPVISSLVDELSSSADPMRALLNFSNLADAVENRAAFFEELRNDARFRRRVCGLGGWAQSVADSLARHPACLEILRGDCVLPSRAALRTSALEAIASSNEQAPLDSLRRWRKRETVRLALFDFETRTWNDDRAFSRLVRGISDLAIVAVQSALQIVTPDSTGFSVFLMGKGGARELNYSSDIDLIFIHDGDGVRMEKIGASLLKALGDATGEGAIWRADMRLRPDGKSGALVPSIGYALGYYESFAAAWEWQALIKMRAIAGDARLARRFRRFTRGITWARRADDAHIGEMLEMKRRMESTPEGSDERNVKTGPGAIRDAEWIVQQLQMMTGPTHPRARAKATLSALQKLDELDAISPDEAARVREGYLFLRVVEHRLQLMDERAVRTLPARPEELAALARRLGESARGDVAIARFEEEHARHRREIRAQCEKIFWAWQKEHPTSTVEFDRTLSGLSLESQTRISRIAQGTATRPFPAPLARQIRAALPAALASLHFAADETRAISNLENLCDASGNRVSLLRSLGDSPDLARAVFAILGGSARLSDTLVRAPQLLDMASNREQLGRSKSFDQARFDCRDYVMSFENIAAGLRRWKTRELLRIGLRDLALEVSSPEICGELADLCQSSLMAATETVLRRHNAPISFAVLGMGKLGGGETHYNSDADVLFVFDVPPGAKPENAPESAAKIASELSKLLGERTADGVCFEVDARLRPDGRSGALVKSIAGYIEYFERENGLAVWERQALTRARYIAGDAATSARLMAAIRAVAFPADWKDGWSDELRHIKARVEAERGGKSGFDVKLGAGAISDIEWTAQWLAMRNGALFPSLQTPNTLRQLKAAHDAQLLNDDEWRILQDAYVWLRRAELRLQIAFEGGARTIKLNTPELAIWARAVFPDDANATAHFEAAWQNHTAQVRRIFERVRDEL